MSANTPHRIDSAQHAVPPAMGPVRQRGRKAAATSVEIGNGGPVGQNQARLGSTPPQGCIPGERTECPPNEQSSDLERGHLDTANPDAWLRAHAADLIGHLQNWSMDLDQRESSLNARIALHERRERQFRVQRSELAQQLASGQARVDQLRQQLEARTRRLAFETYS